MLLWMNEVQAVKSHVGVVLSFHNSIIGASPVVTLRSHRAPGGRFRQDAHRDFFSAFRLKEIVSNKSPLCFRHEACASNELAAETLKVTIC